MVDEGRALALSARWWDELWGNADISVADEILTDPYVRHSSAGTAVSSRRAYTTLLVELQRTLWRPETAIDDRVIVGDQIWTRATSRGINCATGEATSVTWMLVQRVAGYRFAEHWVLALRGVDWTA